MTVTTANVPKGRSPSYPGVSLPTAIERARVAYDRFKRFEQAIGAFTETWGYKAPTTGPATVTFAALKKFGLLQDMGNGKDRTARVTKLAEDILFKPDASADIQKAALLPPIHSDMWKRFGQNVPTYDELRYEFVTQKGFTDNGLRDFLREYRETIAFAKLTSSGTVDREDSEPDPEELDDDQDDAGIQEDDHEQRRQQLRKRLLNADTLTYAVPVAAGSDVTIEGRFPMTEAEWSQFMAVLGAMKPALVAERRVDAGEFLDDPPA